MLHENTCPSCRAAGPLDAIPHEPWCPHFLRGLEGDAGQLTIAGALELEEEPGRAGAPGRWDRLWEAVDASGGELDARDVDCPSCGARAGTYCKRPSGHKAQDAHAARWEAVTGLVLARENGNHAAD